MRRTNLRLHGFGVELACLTAMLLGFFEAPAMIILMFMLAQTAALAVPDAFSRCAAKQMSTKKVMGSLLVAIVLALAAPVGLNIYYSAIGENDLWSMLTTGAIALTTIIRCFEELFASQNDSTSAVLTTALTAIGMSAAILLTGNDIFSGHTAYFAAMAAVAVISGSIALGFSRREWPRPNFAILREIPAAMGRLLLYPALCMGILLLNTRYGMKMPVWRGAVCGGLVGLILLELTKSTFRRTRSESAGLKVIVALSALLGTGGLLALGCFYWATSFPLSQALILAACAAALLLYAPFDWESIAATVVLLGAAVVTVLGVTPAHMSFPREVFIGPAAGIAVCVLMVRQWAQLLRQARANRIRRKAMKRIRS